MKFEKLGLAAPLVTAVTSLGYEEPTPVQSEAIPMLLAAATCSARRPPAPARPPRLPSP